MSNTPDAFDLTSERHHQLVREMADEIIAASESHEDVEQPAEKNVFVQLAHRMARGRLFVQKSGHEASIVVVMNLLGENNRLRPKSKDNPNGEASLQRKLEEIAWLTQDSRVHVDLLYVSGTDWWDSERVLDAEMTRLQELIEESAINVRMVRTSDYPEWKGRRTNDKGGEWNLGLHLMAQDQLDRQYDFVYITDADLMINLAAGIGESLMHHYENNWDVVLGNRKDPASTLQKNSNRSGPGNGWYYYLSRHLGRQMVEMNILDTQCPAKLFTRQAAQALDELVTVDTHAVDTDYLHALMVKGIDLHFVPVVSVDSEAESVGFKLPYGGTPDPAYRLHFILTGQIEQIEKYKDKLSLPNIEDSERIAAIYTKRIMRCDPDKPWMGLSKLLKSDSVKYRDYDPRTDFTPENISIDEFEEVVSTIVEE